MKIKSSLHSVAVAVVVLLSVIVVSPGYSQDPGGQATIRCSFPFRQDNAGTPSSPAVAGDGKYSPRWTNSTTMSNQVFIYRYSQGGNFLGSNLVYQSSRLEPAGMVGLTFNASGEQEGTFCKFVIHGILQGATIYATSLVFRINPHSSFTGQQLSDSYWPLSVGGSKTITVGWTNFQTDDTYAIELFDPVRGSYITVPGTGGGLLSSSGQVNVSIPSSALLSAGVQEGPYQFSLFSPRKRTRQVFGALDIAKSQFRLIRVGGIPAVPRTEEPLSPFYAASIVLDARLATNAVVVKEIRTKASITGLGLVGAGLVGEDQVIIASTTLVNPVGTNLVPFSQLNKVIQPGTFQVWNLESIAAGNHFWGTMQWSLQDGDGVTATTLDGSPVLAYTPFGLAAQGPLITIGPGGNGIEAVMPLRVNIFIDPNGDAMVTATGKPLAYYEVISATDIRGRWSMVKKIRADTFGFVQHRLTDLTSFECFRLREAE